MCLHYILYWLFLFIMRVPVSYTHSDAADDLTRVYIGGGCIIKKETNNNDRRLCSVGGYINQVDFLLVRGTTFASL